MVEFEEGELIKGAYTVIDGKEYEVHMPQYEGETPLSPENMNKMQNDLKNAIEESKIISPEEKIIGTWINGKPIYRKIIEASNVRVTNGSYISHEILNIDEIISQRGIFIDESQNAPQRYQFPFNFNGTSSIMFFWVGANDINFTSVNSLDLEARTTRKYYFTLEYTKTTD